MKIIVYVCIFILNLCFGMCNVFYVWYVFVSKEFLNLLYFIKSGVDKKFLVSEDVFNIKRNIMKV